MKKIAALAVAALLIMACSTESTSSEGIPATGIEIDQPFLALASDSTSDVTLTATVTPTNASNKQVTWASDDEKVVTVSTSGLVHIVGLGNTTVTAKTMDGSFEATCAVSVVLPTYPVTGVTLDQDTLNLILNGASETLVASINPSNATIKTLIWTSDNESVATVSSKGVVTPSTTNTGTATITVKTQDGSFTDTCAVNVSKVAVDSVAITNAGGTPVSSLTFYYKEGDQTATLYSAITPTNASYSTAGWTSSNTSCVTVTSGVITVVGVGTSTISCYSVDDNTKTATCDVTVKPVLVTSISPTGSVNTLYYKGTTCESTTLSASFLPSNATYPSCTWSSSNESIATVSSGGVVTAVSAGSVSIIATATDGSGITGSYPMTITQLDLLPVTSPATATGYTGQVIITWTDPVDTDVANVIVACTSDASVTSKTIAKGTKKAVFAGLTVGTTYTFSITCIDSGATKTSPGKTVSVTPTKTLWQIINGYTPANLYMMVPDLRTVSGTNYFYYDICCVPTAERIASKGFLYEYWTVWPSLDDATSTTEFSLEATTSTGTATGYYFYIDPNSRLLNSSSYDYTKWSYNGGGSNYHSFVAKTSDSYLSDTTLACFSLATSGYTTTAPTGYTWKMLKWSYNTSYYAYGVCLNVIGGSGTAGSTSGDYAWGIKTTTLTN